MATQQPALAAPARPYRDFLTPALHRRFTNAAILSLGLCYVDAIVIGEWDPFWQWFPFGTAGVRTAVLFVPTLAIFVLRLAQLQFGVGTSASGFQAFYQRCLGARTVHTLLWYSFSAWWFCEATIWSASDSAKLGVIDQGMPYERNRLNERPLLYRCLFQMLALLQACMHLYYDYDHIPFPTAKDASNHKNNPSNLIAAATLLKPRLREVFTTSPGYTLFIATAGPVIYTIFLRQTIWEWALWGSRLFADVPKNSVPSVVPPMSIDLFGKFVLMGSLMRFLWAFVNEAFNVFLLLDPLKKDQPLTAEAKDPNGSLLAGLKAKKQLPRNFAFLELALIADNFQDRRKTIYTDIDRSGGPAWTQIMAICLGELHAIVKRIQDFQQPPAPLPKAEEQREALHTLPKISAPLKQENILKNPPPSGLVGNFAKSHGQSPGGVDQISPRAKKLLTYGADALLSKEQQEHLSKESLKGDARSYMLKFLRTPIGIPFRHTFDRVARLIVLGTPLGNVSPAINAARALRKFSIWSKTEDSYGRVHKDIPNIVRTFASSLSRIDGFLESLPPHWTDVEFREAQRHEVMELEEVTRELRFGLRDMVNEFGEYADTLGLSQAELRAAREAVARRDAG